MILPIWKIQKDFICRFNSIKNKKFVRLQIIQLCENTAQDPTLLENFCLKWSKNSEVAYDFIIARYQTCGPNLESPE